MIVQATVLIPTGTRSAALPFSLASVLRQTVHDIEVFVLGAGVPPEPAADPRVRLFDVPAAEPGLAHRVWHEVLAEARGRVVCYLDERDLYLPHHIETMLGQLRQADFAHALHLDVQQDGRLLSWPQDLRLPHHRTRFVEGRGSTERFGVPLSSAGHTLEIYHRLKQGWAGLAAGPAPDQELWRQLLRLPGCRVAACQRPSVLRFSGLQRADWPADRCLAELAAWSAKLDTPAFYPSVMEELLCDQLAELTRLQGERDLAWETYGEIVGQLGLAYHQIQEYRARLDRAQRQLQQTGDQLALTRRRPERALLAVMTRIRYLARLVRHYLPVKR